MRSTDLNADLDRRVMRLLVALREDVAAHERVSELLTAQERTVRSPSDAAFSNATESIERELARAPHRRSQRTKALTELAHALGVAPSALTVQSAVERLGERGESLATEAARLREVAERVRAQNLRVASLVRMHREVTRELLQVVLGTEGKDVHDGGTLIDAEV